MMGKCENDAKVEITTVAFKSQTYEGNSIISKEVNTCSIGDVGG